jgi:hypothetical protein
MSPTARPWRGGWCAGWRSWRPRPRAGGTFTSGRHEATFAALLAARSRACPTLDRRPRRRAARARVRRARALRRRPGGGEMGLGQRKRRHRRVERYRWTRTRSGAPWPSSRRRAAGDGCRRDRRLYGHGSFDDLAAAADLCARRDLWLHVDGAHGASALLSAHHRHRVRGVERADSLAGTRTRCCSCRSPRRRARARGAVARGRVRAGGAVPVQRPADGDAGESAHDAAHAEEFDRAPRVWDQGVRSFQCSAGSTRSSVGGVPAPRADGLGALYDRLCALTARLHARWRPTPRSRCSTSREQHPVLRHVGAPATERGRRGGDRRPERAAPGALQSVGRRVDHHHRARRAARASRDRHEPADHRRAPRGAGRRARRARRRRRGPRRRRRRDECAGRGRRVGGAGAPGRRPRPSGPGPRDRPRDRVGTVVP